MYFYFYLLHKSTFLTGAATLTPPCLFKNTVQKKLIKYLAFRTPYRDLTRFIGMLVLPMVTGLTPLKYPSVSFKHLDYFLNFITFHITTLFLQR